MPGLSVISGEEFAAATGSGWTLAPADFDGMLDIARLVVSSVESEASYRTKSGRTEPKGTFRPWRPEGIFVAYAVSTSGTISISGTSTRPLSVMRISGMTESGMRLKPM
jgi:hypothetical protein